MMRSTPYTKSPHMGMYHSYGGSTGGGGLPTGLGTPKFYDDPTLEALQSRTLYFGRLPSDITDEKLHKLCEEFGDMKKCVTYPQKFMGFVEFYDIRAAEKCRCGLKGYKFEDKTIEVQYSTPKIKEKDSNTGTLYLRPQGADRSFVDPNSLDDYKALFEEHGGGDVKKVSTNRKREAEKFIEFFDSRCAMKAQEVLNGYTFNGVALEVQFAQQPSRSLNKDSKAAEYRRGKAPDGYGPYRSGGHMDSNSAPLGGVGRGWVGPPAAGGAYNPYAGYGGWGGYGGNRGWHNDPSCMGYGGGGIGGYGGDYSNSTSYTSPGPGGAYGGAGAGAAPSGGYGMNRGSSVGGYGNSSGGIGGGYSSSNSAGYGNSHIPAAGAYNSSPPVAGSYGSAAVYGNATATSAYANSPNTGGYGGNSAAGGYGNVANSGYGIVGQSASGYGTTGASNGGYGGSVGGANYGLVNGNSGSGGYATAVYAANSGNSVVAATAYRANAATGYGVSAAAGYGAGTNSAVYGVGGYGAVGGGSEQENTARDNRYTQSGGYAAIAGGLANTVTTAVGYGNGAYATNAYGTNAAGLNGAGYPAASAYGNVQSSLPPAAAAVGGRNITTESNAAAWNLNYGSGMTA